MTHVCIHLLLVSSLQNIRGTGRSISTSAGARTGITVTHCTSPLRFPTTQRRTTSASITQPSGFFYGAITDPVRATWRLWSTCHERPAVLDVCWHDVASLVPRRGRWTRAGWSWIPLRRPSTGWRVIWRIAALSWSFYTTVGRRSATLLTRVSTSSP